VLSRRRLLFALALLLLPVALFPPSGDTTLYYESGLKILREGAVHYRDIVDVKPPFIYHLYALGALLFGETTASFRILDCLVQAATAIAIVGLVTRHFDARRGAIAGLLYAVFYVAQSYNGTAITESYVGALAVPMLALQLRRRGLSSHVAIGLLGGALFLLKFSLATPVLVAAAAELFVFEARIGVRVRNVGLILLGFLSAAALLPLYLTLGDAWQGFDEMNTFLSGYVQMQRRFSVSAIVDALALIARYLVLYFSPTMLVVATIGAWIGFRGAGGNGPLDRRAPLLRLAALNLLVMIGVVALEGKFQPFHFSRVLPFASILGAVGLVRGVDRLRARPGVGRAAMALVTLVAVALSPAPRYARHAIGAVRWTIAGDRGFDDHYASPGLGYSYRDLRAVGETVRRGGGELFVSSSVAGLVHAFSRTRPPMRIFHSAFLIAPYAPQRWRDDATFYLLTRRPHFIVAHLGDSMAQLTGTPLSSSEILHALPGVDAMLEREYDVRMVTEHFVLYERPSATEPRRTFRAPSAP
jgi:4-amino-4-deoxy-L-arabinose transferase-like glycosyltransferase